MADHQEVSSTSQSQENAELSKLKKDLEAYRELMLPLNKVLEWEYNYYPAIVVGIITVLFAIIWYLEPSVLTTFSLLGIIVCVVDFIVPTIGAHLFSSAQWTVVQERQYEGICVRLLNAKRHFVNAKNTVTSLKKEKPKVYLLIMMGAFAALAWIGCLIDNLLLTYLIVVFVMLVPGLRKHGVLQRGTEFVTKTAKQILPQAKAAVAGAKSKAN